MKRFYSLLLALVALTASAQTSDEVALRIERARQKAVKANVKSVSDTPLPLSAAQSWVGSGADSALVVIAWNDELAATADTLVWGYLFNEADSVTGSTMLLDVIKADPRLYAVLVNSSYGLYVNGIGYDVNGNGNLGVRYSDEHILNTAEGLIYSDYSIGTALDSYDHFQCGYSDNRYFAYHVSEDGSTFASSAVGASSRILKNGSRDVWTYSQWSDSFTLGSNTAAVIGNNFANGFFVVNEDWYGHNNGTVNFYDTDSEKWTLRAYAAANAPLELGTTTQYATIYGNRMYLISKDAGTGTTYGARFVMANARTMQSVVSEEILPDGSSARAFVAITPDLGYISTSAGILDYDIDSNTIGAGIDGVSGEIGNMLHAGKYIFAEGIDRKVYAIDTETNTVAATFADAFAPQLSRDGRVWVFGTSAIRNIDLTTLTYVADTIALTSDQTPTFASYAWNASTCFAGNNENTLYWAAGGGYMGAQQIYRVNLDDAVPVPAVIYSLANEAWPYIYGAAIRLRPTDDHIVFEAFKGWSYTSYRVTEIDPSGNVIKHVEPSEANYWFPALIVFPDSELPSLSVSTASVSAQIGVPDTLAYTVSDADSYVAAIRTSILSNSNESAFTASLTDSALVITPIAEGQGTITLQANSNGLIATTAVSISVITTGVGSAQLLTTGTLSVRGGVLTAEGFAGRTISVYDIAGRLVASYTATSDSFTVSLPALQGIHVIKAGDTSLKVRL